MILSREESSDQSITVTSKSTTTIDHLEHNRKARKKKPNLITASGKNQHTPASLSQVKKGQEKAKVKRRQKAKIPILECIIPTKKTTTILKFVTDRVHLEQKA